MICDLVEKCIKNNFAWNPSAPVRIFPELPFANSFTKNFTTFLRYKFPNRCTHKSATKCITSECQVVVRWRHRNTLEERLSVAVSWGATGLHFYYYRDNSWMADRPLNCENKLVQLSSTVVRKEEDAFMRKSCGKKLKVTTIINVCWLQQWSFYYWNYNYIKESFHNNESTLFPKKHIFVSPIPFRPHASYRDQIK